MRVLCEDVDLVFVQRPYAGGLGAGLYVGYATDPPDERVIEYRRQKTLAGVEGLVSIGERYDFGGATFVKTPAVDLVKSPTQQLRWIIPAAAHGQVLWAQVRTHAEDRENETFYRARLVRIDAEGDPADRIGGTLRVLETVRRVGGGLRLRVAYTPGRDGLVPERFVLRCTSGPTSPAPTSTSYVHGRRLYDLIVEGLTHGAAYQFAVDGVAGTTVTPLATAIPFTPDAQGPPAVAAQLIPW